MELGILSWVNHNKSQARKYGISIDDIDPVEIATDDDAVQSFCQRTGTTKADLLILGNQARQIGISRDITEKQHMICENRLVHLLRSVKPDWRNIDGTIPQGEQDNANRYTKFLKWKNNSCAEDAAIFVSIMLDAGRLQIDQLSSRQVNIKPLALLTRHLVSLPWGLLTDKDRSKAREIFVELAAKEIPQLTKGNYKCAISILEECLHGLPQLSFTTIHASRCCDGIYTLVEGTNPIRHTTLNPTLVDSKRSVCQMVNRMLNTKDLKSKKDHPRCSRGLECDRVAVRMQLVLDRMPPVMGVFFGTGITKAQDTDRRVFKTINVQYHTTKGIQSIVYEPIGCVFFPGGNHFTARWIGRGPNKGRLVHYDDLKGSGIVCCKTKNWWEDIESKHAVVAVFYERVGANGGY